jgi:hypothetical protein
MRPSILILVSLAAGCADRVEVDPTAPPHERLAELELCATDIVCLASRVLAHGPAGAGVLYASAADTHADVVDATAPMLVGPRVMFDLALDMFVPPMSRAIPPAPNESVLLGRRSPVTPVVQQLGMGIAQSKLHDGVTLGLLDAELDQTVEHGIAGGMIYLGSPHAESYAVLERSLLSNDRAVIADATVVLERIAPAIPEHMRPVFAGLLREQGVSAAFLH